jgi:hypothetical protein
MPNALEVNAGIEKIPIIAIINANLYDNIVYVRIPYLKMVLNYYSEFLEMILSVVFIYDRKKEIV